MLVDLPMVGRAAELERISERLTSPTPPVIVLAGPAGVGKSRLAAEGARLAELSGFATAHVVATRAAASIPFGPFAPLLPAGDIPATGMLGLLRSVGDGLVERAGEGRRLLLVVDDAHLLDDASAALVHQLAQSGVTGVLVTVRTPAVSPDPITSLWKDGLAERFDIGPLDEAEVAEFTASVLGGEVAGAGVRQLSELSGGNALYLRELILGAVDAGSLAEVDGIWIPRRPLEAPERLTELLTGRLAGLDQHILDVIDHLAVAGSLGLVVLERLTSVGGTEDAERRGLIKVTEESRRAEAHLTHPLYGEVRRQQMPQGQLRRLRGALADAITTTGARRREDLLRLASWQLGAGRGGDPEMLTRAATRARAMFDMALAAKLARAALEAGGGVKAGLVLAVTQFQTGAHDEAERLLADLSAQCTNDEERAAIANARAYNLSVLLGDPTHALEVIEAATREIQDPLARLGLAVRAGSISLMAGDPEGALTLVRPALDSDNDDLVSRACYAASIAEGLAGRSAEALALVERGLEAHRRCVEPNQIPEVQLVGGVLAHLGAGHLATAEKTALHGYDSCLSAGDREGMATFSLLAGCVRVEQGALTAAVRAFREGVAINRELNDTGALQWCLGGLAWASGVARDAETATAVVAELDAQRPDWMRIFSVDVVERGHAWALVATGEITAALRVLRAAAHEAGSMGQHIPEARLLHDIARLGEPGGVRARLGDLAATVDGSLVATFSDHAVALSGGDPEALDAIAERFVVLDANLLAAEAAAAAAAIYTDQGRSRPASAAARKAEEYAAATGVSLPTDTGPPGAERLARREREIATLAADGLSSKDIAAKLVISLRTVDNHLQRIYSKLGVNGREQLGEVR